jgi:hypothetical protein
MPPADACFLCAVSRGLAKLRQNSEDLMIVRGLRDGQVLSKDFRIEQQSLGRESWLRTASVREYARERAGGTPALLMLFEILQIRWRLASKSPLTDRTFCDSVFDV